MEAYNNKIKTILGYHDKDQNRYGLIEKNMPILIKETYTPFIITKNIHFNIGTRQVVNLYNNYLLHRSLGRFMTIATNILIIPGLLISSVLITNILTGYRLFNFLDRYAVNIANLSFWIAIIGVIILWYQNNKITNEPHTLPIIEPMDPAEVESIQSEGFKFTELNQYDAVKFYEEDLLELLFKHIHDEQINTFDIFKDLLQRQNIKMLFKRASIDLNLLNLEENLLNQSTLPVYPVTALRSLLLYTLEEAIYTEASYVTELHLMLAYFRVFPSLQYYLTSNSKNYTEIRESVRYMCKYELKIGQSSTTDKQIIYQTGGIAKNWVYGDTDLTDGFSIDITKLMLRTTEEIGIGHQDELARVIEIINRFTKRNVLLYGDGGVGKTSIIKALAVEINNGRVPVQLAHKKILEINTEYIIRMKNKIPNISEKLRIALDEINRAGNVILFIDNIDELAAIRFENEQSLQEMLIDLIKENQVPVIGSINYQIYKEIIHGNDFLQKFFEDVEVKEIDGFSSLRVLESKLPDLEKAYKTFITMGALEVVIEHAPKLIRDRKAPDNSVKLLVMVCDSSKSDIETLITDKRVEAFIHSY